jgi:hypothetical protein
MRRGVTTARSAEKGGNPPHRSSLSLPSVNTRTLPRVRQRLPGRGGALEPMLDLQLLAGPQLDAGGKRWR